MCSVPDGYGSISSWYQWRSSPPPGGGFGVWKMRSASQTRCHFASIACGSYRSITSSGNKKASRSRGPSETARRTPRCLPALQKQLLHCPDCSKPLASRHLARKEDGLANYSTANLKEVENQGVRFGVDENDFELRMARV